MGFRVIIFNLCDYSDCKNHGKKCYKCGYCYCSEHWSSIEHINKH